jgi:hypothetical protein
MERPLGPLSELRGSGFGLAKKVLIVAAGLTLIALVVSHIDQSRQASAGRRH